MISGLIVAVVAYLFGSFPTAIIAGRLLKKIDIREHGSGNAGATNVVRVLGWKAGLVVLLIDMVKGFIPVFWLAPVITGINEHTVYFQILAALAAIAGHIWTIFAGFRGGKGVGTAAGVFLGLAPLALSIALLFFIIVVALTRYVSLGSLLSSAAFIATMLIQKYYFNQDVPAVLLAVGTIIVALIWFAHRSNIARLLSGTESKISFSGKK
ncbi:MAG: glycerol-3-phosphate 1-O-acyltransferase PlsY [Calditrichae bacterium]|nr:glycerol-3-phosphate 1-O-acyltransferase PlsY [Calditrichota bacterium]MCB9057205.1 glycerol-3-phosphate 1-O-acyltransferase PlsY [Calditrichia bacterium]